MPTQVLTTKLFVPPPRPNALARPALVARLDVGLHRALTLVAAPAGFGKTTLVSAWVAGVNRAVAWLSLDAEDRDVARMLAHLVAALQTQAPGLGEVALALLHASEPPNVPAILTALLNDVAACTAPLLLVLDDYHVAAAEETDQVLGFLVEHLPPQLHLVLVSREEPALPLARLRARDQVTELRAADLRFTSGEAAAFLHEVMGLALAADQAALLAARTEGWAVGLQLAALSLRDTPDVAARIRSFAGSHRLLLDYLVEEVISRQPAAIQRFLLRTSILDRLCGPLCDAVVKDAGDAAHPEHASRILAQLERANLFLVPLDDERRWYRYHHLFAEALRRQLATAPDQIAIDPAELHIRASVWFEAEHLEVEAFYHAAAAHDVERLARLAERSWQGMDRTFQSAAWLARVRQLPEAVIRDRPLLSVQLAWALMDNGDLEGSEARLQDAERRPAEADMLTGDDAEQHAALPAMIAFARAYSAQARGESAAAARYAQDALVQSPAMHTVLRAQAQVLLGLTSWANGELETAYGAFAGWVEQMRRTGNSAFALVGVFGLIEVRVAQGRLRDALEEYRRARREGAEHGPVASYLAISYALLQLERGDREAATQTLQAIEEHQTDPLLVDWRYRRLLAAARLSAATDDVHEARDLIDQARQQYVRTPLPDLRPLAALEAQLWLMQGRLDLARAWASGFGPGDELSYLREFAHLTVARVWLADYLQRRDEGTLRDTFTLLARLLAAAEAGGRMGSVIAILVLQSRAHAARGDHTAAHTALERALTLAEPDGYVQVFLDEGPPLAALLQAQSAERKTQIDSLQPYRDTLLAAFQQRHDANASGAQPVLRSALERSNALAEPLSEREREVLQFIAAGLSNQAIAERLYLSLHTVKVHARNIFAKLGVANRTEAAARGRALGLVPPG